MSYIGETAAIATAISWSVCALFFTSASHRIGSFSMNHYRMIFGIALLWITKIFISGSIFFPGITPQNWLFLSLSGLTGFFIADAFLFQCYVDIGPRLGSLLFNLYPIMSALLALLVLSEKLSFTAWLGMAVTIAGVFWVVMEKRGPRIKLHREHFSRGVLFGLSAAFVQAISFALAKPAMTGTGGADALTATLVRALFACAAYWGVSIVRGRLMTIVGKAADKKAMGLIWMGAISGPFLGVWLSMAAIKYAPIGIASTLMALMPVTILPMTAVIYKEKISFRAIIGALVACIGVAILLNAN